MNRYTFALLFIFTLGLSSFVRGQTDTVLVKRALDINTTEIDTLLIPGGVSYQQVIAGTQFLPNTSRLINLKNHGLTPVSLTISDRCSSIPDSTDMESCPLVIGTHRDSLLLYIDIKIVANCCYNFLGEADVSGLDTLNLYYTGYGAHCGCSCCYTLTYVFDTTFESQYGILNYIRINGKLIGNQIPQPLMHTD